VLARGSTSDPRGAAAAKATVVAVTAGLVQAEGRVSVGCDALRRERLVASGSLAAGMEVVWVESEIVELALPNGVVALVRAVDVDGELATAGEGATKTASVAEAFDFDGVAGTLAGLSEAIRKALSGASPDRVRVDLSVELAVKSGKLTGLLVEGQGKGSLAVSLEWGTGGGGG
jgi:Trypsin-co-occurring domain 1